MVKQFKDRFFLTELHRDERKTVLAFVVVGIILVVLLFNSFYLTFLSNTQKGKNNLTNQPSPTPSGNLSPTQAVISTIPTQTPVFQPIINTQSSVKEYFIPFGIGSNQTSDWVDVPGAQTTVDFENYQNIKAILFETSVNVPTANETVSVRLFNVTDRHPVWYSEVTTTNNMFVTSQPIVYDAGSKVYQVQMKTQLSYPANLTLARLHIILN